MALAKLGVEVTYDEFAGRLLVSGPYEQPERFLDDAAMAAIYLLIDEQHHFRAGKEFFWMVVENEARKNAVHPVKTYLSKLAWDHHPRLDRWLIEYGKAADEPYVRAVGALALIAAVRRIRSPGFKHDEMLVLESEQGTDKSTALSTLAVREEWFTDSLPLDADDKRVIESLRGRWIVEAAEMSGLRRADVEHLKAFLSRRYDRARLAYGRLTEEVPRQCVIFGTTNSAFYLKDSTGNRRFWPVKIQKFDLNSLQRDRDQIWAEAAVREASGESSRLDPALYQAAAHEQELRLVDDPWLSLFEATLGTFSEGRVRSSACWALLNLPRERREQRHNDRLGEIMRALGWRRDKVRFRGAKHTIRAYVKGTAITEITLEMLKELERDSDPDNPANETKY